MGHKHDRQYFHFPAPGERHSRFVMERKSTECVEKVWADLRYTKMKKGRVKMKRR